MINVKYPVVLGIVASLLTAGTLAVALSTMEANDAAAYPKQKGYHHYDGPAALKPGQYAAGTIASLQNDEGGNPTWIVSGHWKAATNVSAVEDNQLPTGGFKAVLDMVMTNGSAMHKHQIYNFTLTDMSMPDNTTMTYNGTATITMRDGPVHDVPISAKVMEGNVLSIWLDPSRLDNHFGDTPIYGTVTKAIDVMK